MQRQYLGCVGKIDNGVVTVHVGVAKGAFQTLLEAELYLPASWAVDRERCRATSPCEVPPDGPSRRADQSQPASRTGRWRRYRLGRKTQADAVWRTRWTRVWAARRWHTLVSAMSEATGEVKHFVTNAVGESLTAVLAVAFRRATVEHAFRVGKTELGVTHFEGRQYVGLMRHLSLTLIVMGFVAVHTERLRGEKSPGDTGAGVPGVERDRPPLVPPATGRARPAARRRGHPLPPAAERASHVIPQETAA